MRVHLLVLTLLVTSGCQKASAPDATTANTVAAPSATADSGRAEPPGPEAGEAPLALDAEGLRVVMGATGSTRLIPFGADHAEVVAAISRLEGAPTERGTNDECGAGALDYASWDQGLTLYGYEGKFAGWYLRPAAAPAAQRLTTMSGIGLGATRTELEKAYTVSIEETTLGTEFAAGDLFGLLEGKGADADITNLWAGTSCFFR